MLLEFGRHPDMCDKEEESEFLRSLRGIDDLTGEDIDPNLIVKARAEELTGFHQHDVYSYVPRELAESDEEGVFIGTRRVDVNKGTRSHPCVRSRLVGQEYAQGDPRDDLFAVTPPVAAAILAASFTTQLTGL